MPPFLQLASVPRDFQPMRGCTGWILTDGRKDSVTTASSVADALGLECQHKQVASRTLWNTLPSKSFLYPANCDTDRFGPPWPDIVLAAGHRTIPYLQALRRASEGATFTVFLQAPRTRLDIADLIWCPAHEHRSGPNIISTVTSPHGMRPYRLGSLRRIPVPAIKALDSPLAAILLGGSNRLFKFDAAAFDRLTVCLHNLTAAGVCFLIAPSKRTPPPLMRTIDDATQGAKRIVWTGEDQSSCWTFLAHADFAIVTADSITTTSAACATGRPVYVFGSEDVSEKLKRFHEALRHYGATRPLTAHTRPMDTWTYPPLDAAPKIASEILRRFRAARAPSTLLPTIDWTLR